MHKMVTMETNGDLMVKMLNSVGYTPDKYLLGLKYVKSSVYYILLQNALTSHFSLFWDPTIMLIVQLPNGNIEPDHEVESTKRF